MLSRLNLTNLVHFATGYPRPSFNREVIDWLQVTGSICCLFATSSWGPTSMVAKGGNMLRRILLLRQHQKKKIHTSASQVEQRSCPGVRPNLSHATLQCCLQSKIIYLYDNVCIYIYISIYLFNYIYKYIYIYTYIYLIVIYIELYKYEC